MLATISSTRTRSRSCSGDCAGRSTERCRSTSPSKRIGTHRKLTSSQSLGGLVVDPVLKSRLLGHTRNHHGLSRFDDQPDDAFSDPIPRSSHCCFGLSVGRFHRQLLAVWKQQHDGSPQHTQPRAPEPPGRRSTTAVARSASRPGRQSPRAHPSPLRVAAFRQRVRWLFRFPYRILWGSHPGTACRV